MKKVHVDAVLEYLGTAFGFEAVETTPQGKQLRLLGRIPDGRWGDFTDAILRFDAAKKAFTGDFSSPLLVRANASGKKVVVVGRRIIFQFPQEDIADYMTDMENIFIPPEESDAPEKELKSFDLGLGRAMHMPGTNGGKGVYTGMLDAGRLS